MLISKKKLTITVDSQVYEGLQTVIGARKISSFLNDLAKPYVLNEALEDAYRQMSEDRGREKKAVEWAEHLLLTDDNHETW